MTSKAFRAPRPPWPRSCPAESAASSKTGSPSGAPSGSTSGRESSGRASRAAAVSGAAVARQGPAKGSARRLVPPARPSGTTPTDAATNSAAQLASDQATIDSDQANLVSAQQSLANGTLKAPMAGTVAAVDVSAGQSVSAGSTSDAITITDPGSYQTTSSLTSSQVGEVATGDHVQVTIDGQSGSFNGTVTRVGPVNSGSSGYTYPLVVALLAGVAEPEHHGGRLDRPGSRGHRPGQPYRRGPHLRRAHQRRRPHLRHHPQSGQEVDTTVKVGVVGDVYTQITSGLSAGTQVVLANTSHAGAVLEQQLHQHLPGLGRGQRVAEGTGVPGFARSSLG